MTCSNHYINIQLLKSISSYFHLRNILISNQTNVIWLLYHNITIITIIFTVLVLVYKIFCNTVCIYCGQQKEPAILISKLLLHTHARLLYRLALTRFCNSWVFHYECMECNCVNQGHFLFMSRLNPILRPHSALSELRSVFPWPQQARSESVVRASPEKR